MLKRYQHSVLSSPPKPPLTAPAVLSLHLRSIPPGLARAKMNWIQREKVYIESPFFLHCLWNCWRRVILCQEAAKKLPGTLLLFQGVDVRICSNLFPKKLDVSSMCLSPVVFLDLDSPVTQGW